MALQYVGGVSGAAAGSTTTGLTLDLTTISGGIDTQPRTGDIVIALVATGTTVDRSIGITTPADFTEISELYSDDSYDTSLSVNYKVMGASPDTSIVTSPSGSTNDALTGIVHVWRGVNTGTPMDVTRTEATGQNGDRPTPPAITPTTSGAIVICCGAGAAATEPVDGYTAAELSNFLTLRSVGAYDSVSGMGSYAWTSGTYTPAQWTGGSNLTYNSWCAVTLALRPSSGSTTTYTPTLLTLNVG